MDSEHRGDVKFPDFSNQLHTVLHRRGGQQMCGCVRRRVHELFARPRTQLCDIADAAGRTLTRPSKVVNSA